MYVVKHALLRCTKTIKTLAPGKREDHELKPKMTFSIDERYMLCSWRLALRSAQSYSESPKEQPKPYGEIFIALDVKGASVFRGCHCHWGEEVLLLWAFEAFS